MIKKNEFILIKLPICILLLLFLIESFAFFLSDYRAVRHGLDRKISYIENNNNKIYSEILLFGDSVTKDIADEFSIYKDKKNIVNLTTNRASGLLGAILLYDRYVKKNHTPKYLVISSTPPFITFLPYLKTKELYLTSVFNSKAETKLISQYYETEKLNYFKKIKYDIETLNLSILNIENNIIYPLINALGIVNPVDALSIGHKGITDLNKIDLQATKKNIKINNFVNNNAKFTPIEITYYNEKLIDDFFKRLKNDGVKLFICWAPIKVSNFHYLKKNKQLDMLENLLREKAKKVNLGISFYNFSYPKPFPDHAFRDEDHLKLGHWRNYYALLLRNYLENKVF